MHTAEYINTKQIENPARTIKRITYNVKQGLEKVVAKQRRILANGVTFRKKTKML